MTAEKSNNNDKPASPMEKLKPTSPRYQVMVDDNFHYQDEDERWQYGVFLTEKQAIAACKRIVDSDLESNFKPGMTATELYELYTLFGDDPFIVSADQRVRFSAWDYAFERSQAMTSHGKAREIGDAGSATETNPGVIEQSKAKDALDALRSGEPPLGSLTSEEQSWLAAAFAHLNRIYEKREAGRPGNNAVCVFDVGNVYVQFLAPWDAELLVCEAVSAKFVPEIAVVLTTGGDEKVRRLGFEAPEISPNYSQTIKIKAPEDIAYAARLGFRVLKQVFRVADFGSATFDSKIPSKSSS